MSPQKTHGASNIFDWKDKGHNNRLNYPQQAIAIKSIYKRDFKCQYASFHLAKGYNFKVLFEGKTKSNCCLYFSSAPSLIIPFKPKKQYFNLCIELFGFDFPDYQIVITNGSITQRYVFPMHGNKKSLYSYYYQMDWMRFCEKSLHLEVYLAFNRPRRLLSTACNQHSISNPFKTPC